MTRSDEPKIREWKNADRVRKLIKDERDGPRGALLDGPPLAAEALADEIAAEQGGNVLKLRPKDASDQAMAAKIEELVNPDPQLLIFEKRLLPVIVVCGLEHFGDHVQGRIKHYLEARGVGSWVCIATCEDVDAIPDWLSSMFYDVRALKVGGRPRKSARE